MKVEQLQYWKSRPARGFVTLLQCMHLVFSTTVQQLATALKERERERATESLKSTTAATRTNVESEDNKWRKRAKTATPCVARAVSIAQHLACSNNTCCATLCNVQC